MEKINYELMTHPSFPANQLNRRLEKKRNRFLDGNASKKA